MTPEGSETHFALIFVTPCFLTCGHFQTRQGSKMASKVILRFVALRHLGPGASFWSALASSGLQRQAPIWATGITGVEGPEGPARGSRDTPKTPKMVVCFSAQKWYSSDLKTRFWG